MAALRNIPSIKKYYGVDVLPGYKTIKEVQRKEVPINPGHYAAHDPRFELILKKHGSFEMDRDDIPKVDVAFIDADHSRQGVINDFNLMDGNINEGGLIIFHDDNCLPVVEVTETLNELQETRKLTIQHISNTWFSIIRY